MYHQHFAKVAAAAALLALLAGMVSVAPAAGSASAQRADVAVGGKIDTGKACYVRLPDLPGARFGGFGGYNADTGVLTFAGGGAQLTMDTAIAYHDLFAIRLDGTKTRWNDVMYGGDVGYTREKNKGCREMTTVQLATNLWVSVLGTGGCDNGKVDAAGKSGGDVRILQVGARPDQSEVRWLMHGLNVGSVPPELAQKAGRLTRHFAIVDSQRGRAVLGQGTFDTFYDQDSLDRIYSAAPAGMKWNVREMKPTGTVPARRYGACAAYVYDKDAGLDGALVLGGKQGGGAGAAYKEVWWLDFAQGASGAWKDVTARFDNMDALGPRWDGACAYNPATKTFYTWMGKVDPAVAGGARSSGGVWRTSLAQLGSADAKLSWERLAPDKLDGFAGRELVPSVYDWKHNRLFALGGLDGLTEHADAWAIYPDVTGEACASLDPFAPFRPDVPPPTATPAPGGTPPPDGQASVCDFLRDRVPPAVLNDAMANKATVRGWGERCYANRPAGPDNGLRSRLSLQNGAAPYHPLFNDVVFKCGCP